MNSYLGVDISSFPDKKGFTLSQPFLIDIVIQALNFDTKTTKSATNTTPAGYPLLNKDENGPARKAFWKYLGIIGMLVIFKGQHVLIFQWQLINAQDSIIIHTFQMNKKLSVLADIYWIQGTRE